MLLVLEILLALLLFKCAFFVSKPQNHNFLLLSLVLNLSVEAFVFATDLANFLVWQMHSAQNVGVRSILIGLQN